MGIEYCDPFDGRQENFWMKLEHCGRYLWAADWLSEAGCEFVADAACANGYGSRLLARKLERVIGVDRSTAYLSLARQAGSAHNVQYLYSDLNQGRLPAQAAGLDAVVCFETLEHLSAPAAALEAFHRCLRPGGYLLLSVPNAAFEQLDPAGKNKDPFHLQIFTREDILARLEAAGFAVLETLGQDLCNRVVTRLSQLERDGVLSREGSEELWPQDGRRMLTLSLILGYPDREHVEDSYSHIYVCRRR